MITVPAAAAAAAMITAAAAAAAIVADAVPRPHRHRGGRLCFTVFRRRLKAPRAGNSGAKGLSLSLSLYIYIYIYIYAWLALLHGLFSLSALCGLQTALPLSSHTHRHTHTHIHTHTRVSLSLSALSALPSACGEWTVGRSDGETARARVRASSRSQYKFFFAQ